MSKTAVSLIRVSTDLQTEKNGGTSLALQKQKLTQYAEMNDLNMVHIFEDVASGGLETRDGIEKTKALILEGGIDIVLTYKTDRCFRSMLGFSKFYTFLKEHDVELISVAEGISSKSSTGELIYNLMMSVGAHEKNIINQRLQSGRQMKVSRGVRGFGSRIPFGYKRNTDTNEIELDEKDSVIVKYIFQKVNQLKKSKMSPSKRTRHLLKLLAQKNYEFHGHPFTRFNIRDLVSNTFYCGELNYGDMKVVGKHKPIVSKRLFNNMGSS